MWNFANEFERWKQFTLELKIKRRKLNQLIYDRPNKTSLAGY